MPYIVHPLHVALMLAGWGAPEQVIQAGLLHDVIEDCEGWTEERLRAEFGDEVAAIVVELTEDKSLSWQERKAGQVEQVPRLSAAALAVKIADKLHNLETLCDALRSAEEQALVWKRFRGGRERTLAHARELVAALAERAEPDPRDALRAALERLLEVADE